MSNITTQLAEQRTALAFIRTVAVFAGLYILMRKNVSYVLLPRLILLIICGILSHRLYTLDNVSNKYNIIIFGLCILMSLSLIITDDILVTSNKLR